MAEYRIVGPVPITYAVAPPAVGKGSGLLKEHHRPALLPQTVAVFFFVKHTFPVSPVDIGGDKLDRTFIFLWLHN
jgi:hypothetical protein